MKLQLVIESNGANLNLVAENQFEIETLARCHASFPEMKVWMIVEDGSYHGSPARGAMIQILMNEAPKLEGEPL